MQIELIHTNNSPEQELEKEVNKIKNKLKAREKGIEQQEN